ncbi:MAG: efflux transporter outer membrane subunit [Muribaculaceae bacterium]|nr:efflux transporter outer membrane subunit [Muribaculaceae bacterium]
MKGLTAFAVALTAILLSACSGVKGLKDPYVHHFDDFSKIDYVDSLCLADLEWWNFYSDSTLCSILERVVYNNRDLLKSEARLEQIRQLYGISKTNLLPEIGFEASTEYETTDFGGRGANTSPTYKLTIPVAWEINLWGSQIWGRREAEAEYHATEEDSRALKMELIAQTAEAYYTLMALENELSIVRRTMETREESVRIAKLRYEGGLTSEMLYNQTLVEYSSAAALVPALEQKMYATRNKLNLLMGEVPQDINNIGRFPNTFVGPEQLPAGMPSDLLKRRPDIRAAEQRLKAAKANVGVTYADRFPSFHISFLPGLENDGLTNFLKSPYQDFIGSLAGPLIDFGRRKKKYKAAIAAYEEARLDYEDVVLKAFTEVNTILHTYYHVQESFYRTKELRDASAEYVQLAQLQFRAGMINYIDVLDAQRSYFDAQIAFSNAIRDQYIALVNIYKALGGGWRHNPKIHKDNESSE